VTTTTDTDATGAPDTTGAPTASPADGPAATGPAALLPEARSRRTVRTNRVVLALVGLLLAVGGAAVLATGTGLFGARVAREPVISRTVERFVDANTWLWPVAGAVAVVLALLSLLWLLRQGRADRVGELPLVRDERGHTDLTAAALTGALEDEVEGYRGATRASAVLTGSTAAPRLSLTVTLDGRVPPAELHARLVEQAVAHARTAVGRPDLPVRIELLLPRHPRRDVR
jgi:hypothetical protein